MSHSHSHSHTHSHHAIESVSTTLIVCIILNLLFVIAEAAIGFSYHSLGLLSDAGHNLSDIFSLLLSLFAIRMAARKGNRHFTYGYKKSTILVSLTNAVILLIAVGGILIESIYKLYSPGTVSGESHLMDCRSGHISERSYRPATDEPTKKRLKHQRSFSAHGHGYTGIRRGSYLGHPYQPDPLLRTRCVHRNGHSPHYPDFYLETLERESLPYTGCRA